MRGFVLQGHRIPDAARTGRFAPAVALHSLAAAPRMTFGHGAGQWRGLGSALSPPERCR